MLLRQVEANIEVTFSYLISILLSPKLGKQGAPVAKTRNCFRVSSDAICRNSTR